eukprot:scpid40981/ scgid2610/ Uncharacterized protein C7orf31
MTSVDAEQAYLSPTFQSSALHAPSDVRRATISDPNYSRYLSSGGPAKSGKKHSPDTTEVDRPRPGTAGHQWGRHWSYGGIGSNVAHEFTQYDPYGRPFGIRGHDHWTTGASVLPRDVNIDESYKLTDMKRSDVRPNDELVPRPLSVNLAKDQVKKRFPADHPFTSHTLQREMFPRVEPPPEGVLDEDTGLPLRRNTGPIPPLSAQTTVRHKTRGASARHEKLILFDEEEKVKVNQSRPLPNDVWDVDRSERHKRALTYPAPQVLYSARPEQRTSMTVRPRTANALANMQDKAFGTTTYGGQHTGRGPQHISHIDDYEEKKTNKEIADMFPEDSGGGNSDAQTWKPGLKLTTNHASSLKPASAISRNSAIPPARFGGDGYTSGYHVAKPREGRHSRTTAANLKVEDDAAAEEYGEITAEGHMRPGTARCRSAGAVRFSNSGDNPPTMASKKLISGSRPGTPWVKRPGTGRYRGDSSDEDDKPATTSGGDGETDGDDDDGSEDEVDTANSTPRTAAGSSGGPAQRPWSGLDNRQKSACRYDTSNFADGWRPGTGVPRPRSTFHERQDAFHKSSVHDQLNKDFPERPPDVRDNQHFPGNKRHTIHGAHSYWYHHG